MWGEFCDVYSPNAEEENEELKILCADIAKPSEENTLLPEEHIEEYLKFKREYEKNPMKFITRVYNLTWYQKIIVRIDCIIRKMFWRY